MIEAGSDAERHAHTGIGGVTRDRLALGTFAIAVIAGGVALFVGLGNYYWFRNDDWLIFTERSLTEPGSWFESHNGHLIALPVVVVRTLFEIFGLDYTPYFLTVLCAHLLVVCLVRWVMRRAGVGPWIATAGAAPLILFGAGAENIIWSFQIAFVLPLAFGMAQGMLADHEGPLQRRDRLGLLFGAAAILCSAVGLVMVAAAGVTAMLRRGWRAALFHVAPLFAVYLLWSQLVASDGAVYIEASRIGRWVLNGELATFDGIAQSRTVALLIAAVIAAGLVAKVRADGFDALRREAALPIAMLVASPALFTLVALGRGRAILDTIIQSQRFVYVGAALTLPAIAVAVQALASVRRELALLIALPLFGVPGNVAEFNSNASSIGTTSRARRT